MLKNSFPDMIYGNCYYIGSEFENGVLQDRVTIYFRTGMARPPYREYRRSISISRKLQDILA